MWANFSKRYEITRWEITASFAMSAMIGTVAAQLGGAVIGALTALLACAMTLITFVDHRLLTIPDALSLPSIPVGVLASVFAFGSQDWITAAQSSVIAAILGASILFMVRSIYLRYRGIEGLGLGDVKLAGAAGTWVGLDWLAATCLLATCAALLAVLTQSLMTKSAKPTLQTAIPFGSFIAPSIVIMWLWRLATV